jgi:hypothetical protein
VSFVAGAFTAVLALASVLDTDLLKFELSPHGTVAFYLALFGGIMAVTRGMIPEENRVFDPELLMTEVITYTHYMPEEWKSQLHSKKVFRFPTCIRRRLLTRLDLDSPRVWRAVCDESSHIRAGTDISCAHAICVVVLLA